MTDSCAHTGPDEPSSEPGSSIIDRGETQAVFPGLEIDIDIIDTSLGEADRMMPVLTSIVRAVFSQQKVASDVVAEVFVRVVGHSYSQTLNAEFRGKNYPTNVLSFPVCEPDDIAPALVASAAGGPPVLLGDIVIAAPVVVEEARAQGKATMDHFCHLMIHGLLHLLGYDHIEDGEAEKMEATEIMTLAELGISNPYLLEQGHG